MFSYEEFKGRVRGKGLSKQNRFYMIISPPPSIGTTDLSTVLLLCQSVSVPGVSIASAPVRTTGETIEAAYDRTFGAASATFYVDADMKVRFFFDEWVNSIQNPTTRVFAYPKEYKSPEIEIGVLRLDNNPSYIITLYDAFPKSIGNLSLSGENNNIMTLDVSFDYRYYTTKIMTQTEINEPTNQQLLSADVEQNMANLDLPSLFP